MTLYDHVAVIAPGIQLDRRHALEAAARSLGTGASVDAELRAARERLSDLQEPVPSIDDQRRRVAETGTELQEERERVATLRGRLQAADADGDTYRRAVRELSEAETEHVAAREALEAARGRVRAARDVRDRRLRLEDRIGNLERRAREELASAVRPTVDEAVAAAPGDDATTFGEADPVTAALALVRAGRVHSPVVLACRRFPDVPTAEAWLRAPVHRL